MMTLDEFKEVSAKYDFVCPTKGKTWYYALGLCGEAGEATEKLMDPEQGTTPVAKELGDVLWYCAAIWRQLAIRPPSFDALLCERLFLPGDARRTKADDGFEIMLHAARVADMVKKRERDSSELNVNAVARCLEKIVWLIARIAGPLYLSVGDVAEMNVEKLEDRAQRGASRGSGDDR